MFRPRVSVTGKVRKVGPWTRDATLAKIDGRTREASIIRNTAADLRELCNGNPNKAQSQLIRRMSIKALRIEQVDCRILAGEELSERESNYYLAWVNSYRRDLVALPKLGEESKSERPPNLRDYFSRKGEAAD